MPASSLVSNPTRTFGSVCRGSLRSTASSVAGLSFAAQPAAFAIDVSFGNAVDMIMRDVPTRFRCRRPFSLVPQLSAWLRFHCKGCGAPRPRDALFHAQLLAHRKRDFIPTCPGTFG